jgi:hypothetical protein
VNIRPEKERRSNVSEIGFREGILWRLQRVKNEEEEEEEEKEMGREGSAGNKILKWYGYT